jgi:hypothetical protein
MKSPDKNWHYIKIDGKNYEFNGRDSLLLTNIFEPQTIFVSDENMIIECGYQYCEKIFFIEEEENAYNELIDVLNEKHLEQFLKEYLQSQEDASDNYFAALYDLHN